MSTYITQQGSFSNILPMRRVGTKGIEKYLTTHKEGTPMHTHITHPMLRAISTITKGVPGHAHHDLHTTARNMPYKWNDYMPDGVRSIYLRYMRRGTTPTPTHGGHDMDDYTPTPIINPHMQYTPTTTPKGCCPWATVARYHHTHTKEAVPMHYHITLTPTTTRRWMVIFTLLTLMYMGVRTYAPLPTWGGIYTLTTVGMYSSIMGTLLMAGAHWYTRTHRDITLSTRDLGL